MTVSRVWQQAFFEAFVSPGRFRRIMPELRCVCGSVFHPGIGGLDARQLPADGSTLQMLPINCEGKDLAC
jgi:hypothetical protein